MATHRGGEHLNRQVHKLGVNSAAQRVRPLHQSGNLIKQRIVFYAATTNVAGERFGLTQNSRFARSGTNLNKGGVELGSIVREIVNVDGLGR